MPADLVLTPVPCALCGATFPGNLADLGAAQALKRAVRCDVCGGQLAVRVDVTTAPFVVPLRVVEEGERPPRDEPLDGEIVLDFGDE